MLAQQIAASPFAFHPAPAVRAHRHAHHHARFGAQNDGRCNVGAGAQFARLPGDLDGAVGRQHGPVHPALGSVGVAHTAPHIPLGRHFEWRAGTDEHPDDGIFLARPGPHVGATGAQRGKARDGKARAEPQRIPVAGFQCSGCGRLSSGRGRVGSDRRRIGCLRGQRRGQRHEQDGDHGVHGDFPAKHGRCWQVRCHFRNLELQPF